MLTHRAAQIVAVVAVTAAAPVAAVTTPVALADECPAIQVVYARGTDSTFPVDQVGQALVNALSSRVAGRSLSVYGINYPASLDLIGGSTDGAADGWLHIQNVVAACPSTQLVLSGYSQGADVIDLLTTASGAAFGVPTPMPASVASHIAAVVVFGNPSRRVGGGPLPMRSALYRSKSVDLCLTGDPVCSNGMDLTAHGKYVSSGLVTQGASFAASQLAPNTG